MVGLKRVLIVVSMFLLSAPSAEAAQGNSGADVIKEICELDGGTFYNEGDRWVCYYPSGDVIVCVPNGDCTLLSSLPPRTPDSIRDYLKARLTVASVVYQNSVPRRFQPIVAHAHNIRFSRAQTLRFYGNVSIAQDDVCGNSPDN